MRRKKHTFHEVCDAGARCVINKEKGKRYIERNAWKPFVVGCEGHCDRWLHPCCSTVLESRPLTQVCEDTFVCEGCE